MSPWSARKNLLACVIVQAKFIHSHVVQGDRLTAECLSAGGSGWTCSPLFLGGRNCRNQRNGQWSCRAEDEFQRVQSRSFPDVRPQSQERRSGADCCYPPGQNAGDPLGPDGGLLTPQARVGDAQQESLQQVQRSLCATGRLCPRCHTATCSQRPPRLLWLQGWGSVWGNAAWRYLVQKAVLATFVREIPLSHCTWWICGSSGIWFQISQVVCYYKKRKPRRCETRNVHILLTFSICTLPLSTYSVICSAWTGDDWCTIVSSIPKECPAGLKQAALWDLSALKRQTGVLSDPRELSKPDLWLGWQGKCSQQVLNCSNICGIWWEPKHLAELRSQVSTAVPGFLCRWSCSHRTTPLRHWQPPVLVSGYSYFQ